MKQNFVLIDSENFPQILIEDVLNDLTSTLHPQLPIKVIAVADWNLKGKKAKLNIESLAHQFSHRINYFKIHDEPSNGKGSNSSDFAITILTLDILYLVGKENIESISIVSSDNDFIPLVKRLNQSKIKVIGFFEKEKAREEYVALFNYSFEYGQEDNKAPPATNYDVESSLKAIERLHNISAPSIETKKRDPETPSIKATDILEKTIVQNSSKTKQKKIIPLAKRAGVNFYLEDFGNAKKHYKHPLFTSEIFKEVFRALNSYGFKIKNKSDQKQKITGQGAKVIDRQIHIASSDIWIIILATLGCDEKKEEFKNKLLSAYPSAKDNVFELVSSFISNHHENFIMRSYDNIRKNGDKMFIFKSPFQFENLYQ